MSKKNFITHGDSYTKLYRVYKSMINRCHNKNDKRFFDYGGRDIIVCDEWRSSYDNFKRWAIESGYADGLTIDRINNNLGYNPENCRWSTRKEQQNNTRFNHKIEYNGEVKTIAEWSDKTGINYNTLYWRISHNWSVEDALNMPI